MLILTALLFFVVAAVFALFGQGGGAIYTPLQVFLGTDFHVAATTSLFLIMVVSASATLVFRRGAKVDVPLVLVLEAMTALGSFAGGLSSTAFSGRALTIGFAGFVTFAALFMVLPIQTEGRSRPDAVGLLRWQRQLGETRYSIHLGVALPASFAAGLASGLLGVGGGLLKVPLMVLLLGIPADIAVGSSAMMIGFTALTGFLGHVVHGHWDWRTSLVLGVVVFLGARLGASFSLSLDKALLKRLFGGFLIVISAAMVVTAL